MPGYRHPGDGPSPEEVLAGLHAEIAAKSPGHARLVARYEEIRAAQPRPAAPFPAERLARLARLEAYGRHRDAGLDRAEAAARTGISVRTAEKYEAAWRAGAPP